MTAEASPEAKAQSPLETIASPVAVKQTSTGGREWRWLLQAVAFS